jgi:hypothetical protein
VTTDRSFPNNKLDIKMRGNEKETCIVIETVISGDGNVTKKEGRF